MTPRARRRWPEVLLMVFSVVVCLGLIEMAMQLHASWTRRQAAEAKRQRQPEVPLHIVVDSPLVYGLNPKHADVSTQGLRNREVQIPKPDGRTRLLMLGDSVTWGTGVEASQTFSAQLESLLNAAGTGEVEVINAGVSGYSTWNQLESYRSLGRTFEPDVVIVGLCLNDVANPRYHWDNTGGYLTHIPEEAVPNPAYAETMRHQREGRRLLLWSLIQDRLGSNETEGSSVPTFITGEDPALSIEVLLDRQTPEWQWLARMIDRLQEAVAADGAVLRIIVFPLEYQLDDTYPYLPQATLMDFFASRDIAALDLLPLFRAAREEGLFLERKGVVDPWHLSVHGHARTAGWIKTWLAETP